jgi:hypothetical protein
MNLDELLSPTFLWRVLGIVGRGALALWPGVGTRECLWSARWDQLLSISYGVCPVFTRLGVEVGAAGHIELFEGRKSKLRHGLAPAFGYLMGHSRLILDSSIYISPLTGRPLQALHRLIPIRTSFTWRVCGGSPLTLRGHWRWRAAPGSYSLWTDAHARVRDARRPAHSRMESRRSKRCTQGDTARHRESRPPFGAADSFRDTTGGISLCANNPPNQSVSVANGFWGA